MKRFTASKTCEVTQCAVIPPDCLSICVPHLVIHTLREHMQMPEEDDSQLVTNAVVRLLMREPQRPLSRMLPFDRDFAKHFLREYPALDRNGFSDGGGASASTGLDWDAVELAVQWLACMHPVFGSESGSYALKHSIEHSIGRHLANGEAIAAALLLPGLYAVERDGCSPNAIIRPVQDQ